MRRVLALGLGLTALAACAPETPVTRGDFRPDYGGIETRLLDGDLVNFIVTLRGAETERQVIDYATCAAAQYALIRGYGFARHIRTNVGQQGSLWRADAVYTISSALPRGVATIDAETTVRDCGARGIPTV